MIQLSLSYTLFSLVLRCKTVIAVLHLKTSENQRTIKKWLKANSDKLTHYSFLLALSEIFSLSIEDLVNIERIKP